MPHKTEVHRAVQVQYNPASGAYNNPVAMPAGRTVARVRARARGSHSLDQVALEHPGSRHQRVRRHVSPVWEVAPWLILCYLLTFHVASGPYDRIYFATLTMQMLSYHS